jgi:acyl-CoA synthetase (AMP-forming)/AMP-acid ligase II
LPEPFGVIISVKETYFTAFPGKYFTGDGALRDEVGYYRITGRVDDVVIEQPGNLLKMLLTSIRQLLSQQL